MFSTEALGLYTVLDDQIIPHISPRSFVGILVEKNGEILIINEFQKEEWRFLRLLGGGTELIDGDLSKVKNDKDVFKIIKTAAIRESKQEGGFEIYPQRLCLIGYTIGNDQYDEKKIFLQFFFSYKLFPNEEFPTKNRTVIEDDKEVIFSYDRISFNNGWVDFKGKKMTPKHRLAVIAFAKQKKH